MAAPHALSLERYAIETSLGAEMFNGANDQRRRKSSRGSGSGATRVVLAAGAAPELEVSAALRNATTSSIQVAAGTQCPLFVRLFPDSTGEPEGALDASMGCPPGGTTLDLAPGDTAVLTRVFRADTLATFARGTYGVNVVVTTNTALISAWAGAVQLPLESAR